MSGREEPVKETKEKSPEKYEENQESGIPEANLRKCFKKKRMMD